MDGKVDPSVVETIAVPIAAAASAGSSSSSQVSRLTSTPSEDEGRFVPGTMVGGRYRIIGLLGRGGMGEVYRATDLTLGQSVALKFLPPEASNQVRLLERFHAEVRVARQVSHPNVCRVYDIGEVEGMPYLSMEYVDGEDLSDLLHRIGRLPYDKALETARKICAGLAAAHDRGVIHRDLKPQNIMMNKRGEVVIMDFGLAAIADQLSGPEARNGTPAYMAPEQLRGSEVTSKSDIYALGLVIYELFTGKRPYEGKTIGELLAKQESLHLTQMTSIAPDIDPAVEKVIRRCLDPDPQKRPQSAISVAAALPGGDPLAAALAAGETPSPEMVAASGKTEGLARKYSIPMLIGVILSLGFSMYYQERTSPITHGSLEYPPDVLQQKARDFAASMGYTRKPVDTWHSLEQRGELIDYLKKLPGDKKFDEWLSGEGAIKLNYRESLDTLYGDPFGTVNRNTPAATNPGMVYVAVDGHGRVIEFTGIPYSNNSGISPSPDDVFRAAGLDRTAFHEETPTFVPTAATDQLWQWKGKHPTLPNTDLTLEMASWKGQLTHFRVRYPWSKNLGDRGESKSVAWKVRSIILFLISSIGCLMVILMARRNWKVGRGDRRGALRLAVFRVLLSCIAWAGSVHPVANDTLLITFFVAGAEWLMVGGMVWLLYLALEPALRARWPHSIVTWNRVLNGNWTDAQVGAHVLIGATVGASIWLLAGIIDLVRGEAQAFGFSGNIYFSMGVMQWLGGHASVIGAALITGLVVFFTIFGVKVLVKRDYIAALLVALFFTFAEGDVFRSNTPIVTGLILYCIFSILSFVLLRFGLVATIVSVFFLNGSNNIILGANWKTWYAPASIAIVLVMTAIAVWAFVTSLGDRELLGGESAIE